MSEEIHVSSPLVQHIRAMSTNQRVSMKAVQVSEFGGPSVLKVQDIPVPTPAKGQVLVKVFATGINPVETYIRSGTHSLKPALPYTPGNDGAGIVEAVGPDVTSIAPGARVFLAESVSGTYAQYALATAEAVIALPEKLSYSQGAAISVPYKTAFLGLKTLFVHGGSGAVGVAAIQMGRALGMHVIASAGTPDGLALVQRVGAHSAVNHREPGYLASVKALTGGKGVDVILEMAAHINFASDFDVLAPYGAIAVIGSRGPLEFNPRLIMGKSATVVGIMAVGFASEAEKRECWAAISAGLDNGTLSPIVGHTFPLEDTSKAHVEVIEHAAGTSGKIVVHPWE